MLGRQAGFLERKLRKSREFFGGKSIPGENVRRKASAWKASRSDANRRGCEQSENKIPVHAMRIHIACAKHMV